MHEHRQQHKTACKRLRRLQASLKESEILSMSDYKRMSLYVNNSVCANNFERANFKLVCTLLDMFDNFFDFTDCTVFTVYALIKSIVTTYDMQSYTDMYRENRKILIDEINDALLKRTFKLSANSPTSRRYYFDSTTETLQSDSNITEQYRHSIKATYNLDAYINQYTDFYSNI